RASPSIEKFCCAAPISGSIVATQQASEENSIMRMHLVPFISAALVLSISGPSFCQEWVEFASQEERITCLFPTQPKVTETIWASEYGAVLPARVYSATQGQNRYSLTVVDYNPVERLLVEKSKSC